ncbi:hypothetical protein LdCL_060012800 [Leishmania donovani]|uniref:Uncharacterized protein n=2 Tax=Leishmania donovani TaxID=5661 RepID=A0A3S7WPI2_LEIDO|nr:hypothetical protein LdCL_060012800 [Leishmania donovani]
MCTPVFSSRDGHASLHARARAAFCELLPPSFPGICEACEFSRCPNTFCARSHACVSRSLPSLTRNHECDGAMPVRACTYASMCLVRAPLGVSTRPHLSPRWFSVRPPIPTHSHTHTYALSLSLPKPSSRSAMMLSASSSSSSSRWGPPLERPASPQHPQQQQQQRVLQGNAHFMSLLQRPREGPPLPQVPADNAVPAPRVAAPLPAQEQQQPLPSHKPSFTAAAAVLSPNAFVQAPPQLQREREHPQHRSVPADGTSATATSRGGGGDIDDSSSAPSDASVPASWPCESSALPHHDEDSGRSSDGTYQFTTTSSTMTGRRPVSPEHTTSVRSSDDTTCLVDLRRRDAAQVEKCDRRRPTAPGAVGASAAVVSPSFSTSSCGCPSNCACRSDASDDDVFGVSVDAHGRARPAWRVRPASWPRAASADERLDACTDCRERAAQDMTRCSDASSETGTTPLQRSSEEDGDDLCSSCRQHRCDCGHPSFEWRRAQRGDGEFSLKLSSQGSSEGDSGSGEDASLCSLCKDAARTRAVHQAGAAAFFAHQEDPFSEAVREDRRCAGVPPLLRLSTPSSSASTKRGSASDAVTMAQRERADRRMVYMQSAAALASDAGGERRGAHDAAVAAVRGLDRCTGSTQTDTVAAAAATATLSEEQRRLHAEQEAAALKSIAAAHVAEVTRPLLQGELASFEARAAVQQQARFDVVESQLRVYLDEFRQRMQELSDLQMQQHATRQEEAEAVRRAAARVDRATSPMDSALIAEAAASTPQAAPSPVPPQRTVGTQHSDGTLELLTIVRTEAASWMAQLLFSIEAERRDAVMQDEAESRDRLLHVMEEPRRRQLLRYQAELLHWQQECAAVRHRASFASDLLALELRERLVRQELNEEASVARRELGEAFERQRCQAAEAAAHSQVKALEDELVKVRSKLSIVEAEHADTLEHAKQLRLQLIHALRMPTVTLVDRSGVPAAARGAGDAAASAAYAYANATAETGPGDTLGMRGDTQGCADRALKAHAASSTGSGTGVAAWHTVPSGIHEGLEDLPVHRRFARAHQEALRVTRAQCRTV